MSDRARTGGSLGRGRLGLNAHRRAGPNIGAALGTGGRHGEGDDRVNPAATGRTQLRRPARGLREALDDGQPKADPPRPVAPLRQKRSKALRRSSSLIPGPW